MPAVRAIANAPQNVTRAMPRRMWAPPTLAPIAPKTARKPKDAADTMGTSALEGDTTTMSTGIAALFGQLPGAEPAPYILRFTEDRPNPRYRRICYTFAWNALLNFALLDLAGLAWAACTGQWRMKQIYAHGYTPLLIVILLLGALGILPRVRPSTQGEGSERRYFYGAVWAITAAQSVLLILWKTLPKNHATDIVKLVVYCVVLIGMGVLAAYGVLPRTRPILPGELMVAD